MLKKDITFKNFDGKEVTKTFYFHLTKLELAEKEIMSDGGYAEKLKEITQSGKASEVYPIMKELILDSVGNRTDDGDRFEKSEEIRNAFLQSNAYETLIFEMLKNAALAAEFMNAIMPADLVAEAQKISGKLEQSEEPSKPKTLEDYNMTELTNMPYLEFEKLMKAAPSGSLTKEQLQLAFQRRP